MNELKEQKNTKIQRRFNIGDKVMIRVAEKKPGIHSKRFEGPGRVIKEKNNDSYEIEIGSKRFIRHEDHIKLSKAVKKISSYP